MAKLIIDGNTSLYALAGNNICFSSLPELFNEISSYIGYNSVMVPVNTEQYGILKLLDALKLLNCKGALIDTPHRCELSNELISFSDEASSCNAVNAVRIDERGVHGHNTEINAFRRAFPIITGEDIFGKRIFMFGSGGIARVIAVACGIEQCESLTIANRTSERAELLCDLVNSRFGNIAFSANFDDADTIHNFYNADIIIHATSTGMFPQMNIHPLPKHYHFMSHHIVLDTVYNPPQTKLMQMAEEKGCKAFTGRDIMFFSCFDAFQWWTDVSIEEETEKKLFNIWKELIYNI